jgi:hypothetical protein
MASSDLTVYGSTPYAGRAPEPRLAWAYVAEDDAPVGDGGGRGPASARRTFAREGVVLVPAPDGPLHRLVPVTAFSGLPPRRRPHAFCPVCLERVILKLGPRNRHHYGHLPRSTCAAARGEGALHLSAKLHLAAALEEGGASLRLRPLCARIPEERTAERCARADDEAWTIAWDGVRVEASLPSARADLVLLRGGREVAAIEVCSHHAVDDAKAAKYRALDIPWIEVPAWSVVPEAGVAWTPAAPLPVLQESRRHPGRWRCERHQRLHDDALEHERTGTHLLAARVVHLYRADGGRGAGEPRVRATRLWMVERREAGRTVEGWLERDGRATPLGEPVRVADRAGARRALHARFRSWARWMRDHEGVVVDSPMSWVESRALDGWRRSAAFPERLRWDPHRSAFAAVPNLPAVAWPSIATDAAQPDPVLGWSGCAWTALDPARYPLLHAVVAHAWVTARTPGPGRTLHLRAHLHDGERWRAVERAPFVATPSDTDDPAAAVRLALAFAGALAVGPPDELLDGVRAAEIVVEIGTAAPAP